MYVCMSFSGSSAVVGSGLSCEHREVFCPSSARSRINVHVRVTSAWVFGSFFLTSARFFVAAAEDLSAKQRNVSLQHAARKLRVCYTHTNAVVGSGLSSEHREVFCPITTNRQNYNNNVRLVQATSENQ